MTLSRFPDGVYVDVAGLCKAVTSKAISESEYSLTPGRYVGVALGRQSDDDGEVFMSRMKEIHADLTELNDSANVLAAKIQAAFAEISE